MILVLGSLVYSRLAADAAVTALVGTRIFAAKAKQGAAVPRIVFTIIGEQPTGTAAGSLESRLRRARIQVDCYADTVDAADDLANKVEPVLLMTETPLRSRLTDRVHLYDDETGLRRVSMDFIFQPTEA